jgi:hypothetical protein
MVCKGVAGRSEESDSGERPERDLEPDDPARAPDRNTDEAVKIEEQLEVRLRRLNPKVFTSAI